MNLMRTQNLHGQTAVVTGATGGIGRAITLELAARGAACVVHTRRHPEIAASLAQQIVALGGEATIIVADVASAHGREALVDTAWSWRNGVKIWVNNAGADILTGEASSWSFEQKLSELWHVDVAATAMLSRAIGRRMQSCDGGAIVNIGWDQAEFGMAGDSGELFGAAKGAVIAFTRSLARTLAPRVRVNCVAPGWIKTDWGRTASDYWQRRAVAESLAGRWGDPEDVAHAVAFLVGPEAEFICGSIVPVNGGFAGPYHEPRPRG